MSSNLGLDDLQLATIRRYFTQYDPEQSGSIDKSELGNLSIDLGDPLDDDELADAVDALDKVRGVGLIHSSFGLLRQT